MLRPYRFDSMEAQLGFASDYLSILDHGRLFGRKLTENDRQIFRNAYVDAISNAIGFAVNSGETESVTSGTAELSRCTAAPYRSYSDA